MGVIVVDDKICRTLNKKFYFREMNGHPMEEINTEPGLNSMEFIDVNIVDCCQVGWLASECSKEH